MNAPWKNILLALLMTFLPIIYSLILSKSPEFPITQESFITLVVWAVGLFFGGWQTQKVKQHYLTKNRLFKV